MPNTHYQRKPIPMAFLNVLVDEAPETPNPCVDTRESRKRTPSTPAHSANQRTGARVNDRAAAVTLARVLAARIVPGADLIRGDSLGWRVFQVVGDTCGTANDRDVDLAEAYTRLGRVLCITPAVASAAMSCV